MQVRDQKVLAPPSGHHQRWLLLSFIQRGEEKLLLVLVDLMETGTIRTTSLLLSGLHWAQGL